MDQWAFFDEFKAGTVRNVYLFYGPEAYIRKSALATLQKKLLMPGLEAMNWHVYAEPDGHSYCGKLRNPANVGRLAAGDRAGAGAA